MSVLDREALFADETGLFRSPVSARAEDVITFRFRAGKGSSARVRLLSGETEKEMENTGADGPFDRFETKIRVGGGAFFYCFRIETDSERLFFSRAGVTEKEPAKNQCFSVLPGFSVPDWAKGAVMYQIFPDRFCDGDPASDTLTGEYFYNGRPVEHAGRDSLPKPEDVHRFFGGDLPGILSKLDYLKYLGVEVIYLNPVFLSPSNHKYDAMDYEYVDPHLTGFVSDLEGEEGLLPEGVSDNRQAKRYLRRVMSRDNLEYANAFFARFISELHARGMKVILDGVFNHCGSFHRFMDGEKLYLGEAERTGTVGAYIAEGSPYHGFFVFGEEGHWPDNSDYDGWWGYKSLPKLFYEGSKELEDYILDIARKWVSPPYNADGWRLDMAADLGQTKEYNHEFFRKFRQAVKSARPDALILAEHYGDPSPWLQGDEWDSVMNYDGFMDPVSFFLTGMEKHSDWWDPYREGNGEVFFGELRTGSARFPAESLQASMLQLSNHDHSRFLTRTNRQVGRLLSRGPEAASHGVSPAVFKEGTVMLFTLPGAPTIYYGDEAGLTGWTDPDSRRPYPWGKEDFDLLSFHHEMIRIHKSYSCLRTGSFLELFADRDRIAYGRFDARSAVLVLINHSSDPQEISVRAELLNIPREAFVTRVMETGGPLYNAGEKKVQIKNGRLSLSLPALSASVFAYVFD